MKLLRVASFLLAYLLLHSAIALADEKETHKTSDFTGHWAESAISRLIELKAINGYEDGSFRPEKEITRAEFLKILVESLQLKKASGGVFEDIKEHWAQSYIETAVMHGVIVPIEIGAKFKPDNYITRIDMISWMMRGLKLEKLETQSPFVDATLSYGYATRAYMEKLIDGYVNDKGELELRPERFSTRAEAATIITRILDYMADPEAYKKSFEEKGGN